MRYFNIAAAAVAASLIALATVGYFDRDSRGQGVIAKKYVIEAGEIDWYMIETARGETYFLMLGKPMFDDLRVGGRVRFRYRGYPIKFGLITLVPAQIYYVVMVYDEP
jgi:hypothetical protein